MISTVSSLYTALFIFGLLVPSSSATGQERTASVPVGCPDSQVLAELVAEVRQLRTALERTTSVSSRVQITL